MSIHKRKAYTEAILFRKRGFTYAEIAKLCNVSRGTVSNWLRHEEFSKRIAVENKKRAIIENTKRLVSINKARNTERRGQYADIERMAEVEYKHYHDNPLFVAGLTIYFSNGDQTNEHLIRFSGNRSELHQVFVKFLLEYLGVEKQNIHFWLLLYPDQDEITCMKHWCKKVGLSSAQFYKNQVIKSQSSKRTLQFGIGNTIINSTLLKKKLNHWIKLMTKEIKVQ